MQGSCPHWVHHSGFGMDWSVHTALQDTVHMHQGTWRSLHFGPLQRTGLKTQRQSASSVSSKAKQPPNTAELEFLSLSSPAALLQWPASASHSEKHCAGTEIQLAVFLLGAFPSEDKMENTKDAITPKSGGNVDVLLRALIGELTYLQSPSISLQNCFLLAGFSGWYWTPACNPGLLYAILI